MLLFQAFVICLTGSLRSRYRLSFEPWFLLGFFAFLDAIVPPVTRLFRHRASRERDESAAPNIEAPREVNAGEPAIASDAVAVRSTSQESPAKASFAKDSEEMLSR